MTNYPSISGYEIIDVLGKGGTGTVYLARQLSLNRSVAIKILPDYLANDSAYVMRFRQEATSAAQIKHPGIVQIYDAGEDNGQFYFVMEYVNGETTASRVLRKGYLDDTNALLIGEAVAAAMEHAWNQTKLVHRDIKPDNILIDSDGTVKVADLGLAKLVDQSSTTITMSKALIGTPHYCAPEQARGSVDVDCRSDIYALGATLYHFVTGSAPFSETPGISAMVKNITDYLPNPVDCNPDVSDNLSCLIEKMMVKDRQNRHQSWSEVLDDIGQVIVGKPPLSERPRAGASTVKRSSHTTGKRGRKQRSPVRLHITNDKARTASSSSFAFRLFLVIATIFTIALYTIWFRIEAEHWPIKRLPRTAIRLFTR